MSEDRRTFLQKQDLHDLTGSPQQKKQIEWLIKNGYRFDVGLDGEPKVLWDQVRERQLKNATPVAFEPNYEAVNG